MTKPNHPHHPKHPDGDKGHGGKHGGKKKHHGGKRYGGYAGYKGVKRSEATSLVNADIKKFMHEMKRELKRSRRDTRNQVKKTSSEYGRTKADLNHIFGETGEFITGQNKEIDDRYNATKSAESNAQAALQAQIGQSGRTNIENANSELSRLGIQGNFTDQVQADQINAQNSASIIGANNQANLGAMQGAASSIGSMLLGANSATQGSLLGNALRSKNDVVSSIRQEGRDYSADVHDQMNDMRSERGGMVRQLLQQLAQTGWAQYVDQRNLSMQRRSMNHGFAMDNAAMQQQQAYSSAMAGGLGSIYGSGSTGSSYGSSGSSGSVGSTGQGGRRNPILPHPHAYPPLP